MPRREAPPAASVFEKGPVTVKMPMYLIGSEQIKLKPQDSFGRFVKFVLDLQKVDKIYHQKAPLNPSAIVLNDML